MKKTIISLSIISLLAGCGGGGGSSTPDDKKPTPTPIPAPIPTPTPTPTVDFPLKGATFDAANINSTTLHVKVIDKTYEGISSINEEFYEFSTYQPISEDLLPSNLNKLENHNLANNFFKSTTAVFEDAALTKPKKDENGEDDKETSYGAKLIKSPFITFVSDDDLEKQPWSLPDFIADGDYALGQPASYQANFQAKLGTLNEEETKGFLEEYGFNEKYSGIIRCESVDINRAFDFSRSNKETITIKGKSIETWKMNVRDYVSAVCEQEGTRIPKMINDVRNSNSESVEAWYNPTLGIIKIVENKGKVEEIMELVDFSISQ
ncbi:hypothetical protein C9J01_00970 [Photobacterium rosenbergii]|uniref:Lipoprotein n=1 Tax=Photobacterium rosenbergii TaxID=294936 RepID=A0A2T3NJG8_9GAMM|nr:hypothetical protein [Photobacterium rosenbergii]PSW15619.1 hypothetical protein C9J01_00970 [Photobacterium rosenbergii]